MLNNKYKPIYCCSELITVAGLLTLYSGVFIQLFELELYDWSLRTNYSTLCRPDQSLDDSQSFS